MESWLRGSGAVGLENLELADFPITGRGVKTRRHFKQGETILTIPHSTLWTAEHAYADPTLGPVIRSISPPLSVEDALAVHLLFVRSRKSGYDGPRKHVAALPASYSSSIFFSRDELEVCAGTSLYTITKQLELRIEADYKSLIVRVLGQNPDLLPLDEFTIQDYKWALCTIWSRAMDFTLPDGKSLRLLAPYADMLNHSSEVEQCHAYDASSRSVSILAGKDYEAGQQIFINYGRVPNSRPLRLYGFIIPGNPDNSYDLVLATHSAAPFFAQKQKLWALAGLDSTSTITLTMTDPLPKHVLQYLRIQRLDKSDLAVLTSVTDAKISDANETEVLRFLIESIDGLLNSLGIQLERLQEQLAEGVVYSSGGNAWAAAHVSLGEQQVLRLARKKAEDLLAAVEGNNRNDGGSPSAPGRCVSCKKTSMQLMLCGRCKSVTYCGRTCQVAHYKEHKATCRATASKGS